MDVLAIDPTVCTVRHIRRGAQTDPSAQPIARGYLVRSDVVGGADGLNGRQGWQQSDVTCVLSDDGTFKLMLPNAAGDDGILHRRRFAALTDPNYEPGEEWLEFWTDADQDDPLFVGTPTDYAKAKQSVTISGKDLGAVLDASFSSDVDAWDGTAPADLIRHYSRLPVLAVGVDSGLPALAGAAGAWGAAYTSTPTGVAADSWTVEARLRMTSAKPAAAAAAQVRLTIAGLTFDVDAFDGAVTLTGAPERPVAGKRAGLVVPGPIGLRIVARYDRIFAFVEGELVAEFRRPAPWAAVGDVSLYAYGTGTAVAIDALQLDTLAGFAARGPSAIVERHLPGIPPATGLRGRYYNAAGVYAQNATRDGRLARLWPLTGEAAAAVDRLDPQLNFPAGTANYPPNLPGAYAARWTGAIYLDLAASDRKVRLSGLVGNARLYIGRTLRGDEAATSWLAAAGTTPITTAALRAWLGESVAGWFPILVEHAHDTAAAGIVLEDTALDGSGNPVAWATVPTSRLSPIGVVDDLIRLESHRQVIGEITQTFGYQWRTRYRSLESGEFPGQLIAQAQVGRQTAIVVDDDQVGTDAEVQGAAGDVVDGMLADAAGIADAAGSGQLTAQVIDYPRASGHLALRQGYESLSEISEQPLLVTRLDTLLTLRASPNEHVGVRPSGQHDLVDTFPLTGQLAKMAWEPGDGVLLALDSVDVVDQTPRQMTSIGWSPRPDALGAPTVSFRQRPRSPRAARQRLRRAIFGPQRNYQGGLAILNGSLGGATNAGAAVAGASDQYSRAPLPRNLDDITRAVVVVESLAGAGWRLEVAGVDLGAADGAVPIADRYDITRAVKAAAAGTPQLQARLIGGAAGSYLLTLEIWVRV